MIILTKCKKCKSNANPLYEPLGFCFSCERDRQNDIRIDNTEINIKMNKRTADDLLSFVKQTIMDAQETLNTVDPEDKLLVGVWKNGLNFWNDVKDAIVNAQV